MTEEYKAWADSVFDKVPEDMYKSKTTQEEDKKFDYDVNWTREFSKHLQNNAEKTKDELINDNNQNGSGLLKEPKMKPMAAYGYNKKVMHSTTLLNENSRVQRGS